VEESESKNVAGRDVSLKSQPRTLMPALSAGDGSISIAAGIIIGLFASCVQSLGLTIQRKSHVVNQELPDHLQRVEHRRP
jgi:magnesium transporter